jgi:hypothetical protein
MHFDSQMDYHQGTKPKQSLFALRSVQHSRSQCEQHVQFLIATCWYVPVPLAVRSKAYIFGRLPDEMVGANPTGGTGVCLL